MNKRNHATSLKLVLGVLVAATGCGSEAGGNNGLTGTAGVPIGASGIGVAPAGQAGIGIATAGSTAAGSAGRAGVVAGTGSSSAGTISTPAGRGGMTAGTGTTTAGTGAITAGTGTMTQAGTDAMTAGTGAITAGTTGMAGTGTEMPPSGGCTPAPPGKFQTMTKMGGPGGNYTIIQPTMLGQNGFKHPPVAWGNGVTTTPTLYVDLLNNLASQGFVVIADPGVTVTAQIVRQGLEWLIEQDKSGEYAGKLAVNCAGTIGYSMGGGSAVGAGAHPAVKAVVSFHGLSDAAENAKGPILLTTSEGDTFVTKSGFVAPCYQRSTKQPTILASHAGGDHLDPLGNGGMDAEPGIAWLRYWIYGDQSQKDWFFGADCKLCKWPDFRRKNHPEWK